MGAAVLIDGPGEQRALCDGQQNRRQCVRVDPVDFAAQPAHVRSIVLSRTLNPSDHPKVTIEADSERVVREIRDQPGKDIWLFGGGELFRSLLAVGLVDCVEVAVIPVLLGEGIPLLPSPAGRTALQLRAHRVYEKTGTLSLEYDIVRD